MPTASRPTAQSSPTTEASREMKDDNESADIDTDTATATDDDDSCQQRQHDHDHDSSRLSSSSSSSSLRSGESPTSPLPRFCSLFQLASSKGMDYSQIVLMYRAEGNANLVLALPQFGKVLRLPKMSIDDTPKQHQSTSATMKEKRQIRLEGPKDSSRSLDLAGIGHLTMADYVGYINILRHLVGNVYVLETEIIEIPNAEQRMWINDTVRPLRPAHRLDKEFCGQFGLMLPDATLLPQAPSINSQSTARATPSAPITTPAVPASGNTFAIEIKPKQGWFPSDDVRDLFRRKLFEQQLGATPSPATSAETRDTAAAAAAAAAAAPEATHPTTAINVATTHEDVATKIATHSAGCSREKATTRCRYCAMQYLKLKRHKIEELSAYCPMDLFSGITTRMTSALSALFECPQNNLRIFHNGNLIYGDHSASMSWNDLNEHVFKDDMLQMVQKLLVACLLRNYEEQDEHDEEEKGKGKKEEEIKNASKVEKGSGTDFVAVAGTTKTDAAVAFIETVAGQPHPSETLECNMKDKKAKKRRKTKKKKNNGKKNNQDELIPFEYPKKRKQEALKRRQKRKKRVKRDEQKPKKCREPQGDKGNDEEEEAKPERIPTQIIEAELFCLPKKSVLHKVLQLQLLAKRHLLFMCDTENQRLADNSTKSYETLAQLLASGDAHAVSLSRLPPAQQYLIGATALDCSVMVTFAEVAADAERPPPPHSRRNLVHLMDYNKTFVTEVTLLDLDPKPDNHCDKYIQQTVEAYQSCAESLREEI